MAGALILPPRYVAATGPLVFLAGPIQGAPDWQQQAIGLLRGLAPGLHLACPRREYLPGEFDYAAQIDWETHHLRQAGRGGPSCSGWRGKWHTAATGPTARPRASSWPSG